jgi:hypothetical protein
MLPGQVKTRNSAREFPSDNSVFGYWTYITEKRYNSNIGLEENTAMRVFIPNLAEVS